MSKKPPDPSPPPKVKRAKPSEEEQRFHGLLKKLLAVPKTEVDALEMQRQKRSRKERRGAVRSKERQG